MSSAPPSYQGHRYPAEIISHCAWRYFRFPLSFREVEELMLARGVIVSYGSVRRWCAKCGQAYAGALRRRRPRPGDTWHPDEVFIKINGEPHYRWRAVDADGTVLDILVQNRRDTAAARRFFRTLLQTTRTVPRVVVTDSVLAEYLIHAGQAACRYSWRVPPSRARRRMSRRAIRSGSSIGAGSGWRGRAFARPWCGRCSL
ncbi:hypothetical protein SHIRM173S_02474 [Streptomyces hirsutus]